MNRPAARRFALVLLACTAALVAGCSSTKIIGHWSDPEFGPRPLDSVLVVAVSRQEGVQRMYESTLTRAIEKRGTRAAPGHAELPAGKLEKGQLQAAAAEKGFDAVLITRKVRVEKRERYVPGATYAIGSPYYGYGRMYPYYAGSYSVVHQPGYLEEETVIQLETNLYSGASGELVWSARSETVAPRDLDTAIHDISDALVDDLRSQGLLP